MNKLKLPYHSRFNKFTRKGKKLFLRDSCPFEGVTELHAALRKEDRIKLTQVKFS